MSDPARDLVLRRLAAQARRFPDLDLADLDTAALPPRDAAFAHAIYDAVIRRWLTLAHLLNRRLTQPLSTADPRAAAALLAGAAQLLLLDKVPPHAAINHAVEWTKRRAGRGAAGMVNAVLRRIADLRAPGDPLPRWADEPDQLLLSDGRALRLTEPAFPDAPSERLAAVTGTPAPLLRAWASRMTPDQVRTAALHTLITPPVILNTTHAQSPLDTSLLAPHDHPGHHVFTGSHAQLLSLLASRSDLWVQDPASSLAVAGVADLRPRLILDLCAGQGTKTRQLAAVFPNAEILATDVDPARYRTLESVFAGHSRVCVRPPAEVAERARAAGGAHLILLDVPCSNTGVLARRPEARYRFGRDTLDSLRAVQRQIIADAIPLLVPAPSRGVILYSTCSLEDAENTDQAAWARTWHGFTLQRERRHLPQAVPGDPPSAYTDGSYSVLLA